MSLLNTGERAEILKVKREDGDSNGFNQNLFRLDEMGLKPGKEIEMLQSDKSILLIKIDNSRIAVSRKIAFKIFVRKI
jgi:ferrous iron transport protein A